MTAEIDFLASGYGEPEHQEDHARKIYLLYRERGFNHREAVYRAKEKAEANIWHSFPEKEGLTP